MFFEVCDSIGSVQLISPEKIMMQSSWKKIVVVTGLIAFVGMGFVFVSRLYENKNKDSDSPSIQVSTNSGEEKVFSRSEMRAMLEGFGEPSEEDIRVFQKDERYGIVLDDLSQFKENILQEKKNLILWHSYLLWFRKENLGEFYDTGKINMDGFLFGSNVILEMYDNAVRSQLSDDQYLAFMGMTKNDPLFLPQFSESTHGYSDITSIFPAIRNGEHPEIQSSEDLYKVIPKETIEKIKVGEKERSRIQRKAVRAFRLGKISEEEYEKQIEASTQAMRDAIKSAVTPEQEMFLFGYEF